MTVGDRIKEKRIALNMSQDELAQKVGYKSRSSIQKIESARSLPLSKVVRMANALDCAPAYLMGWETEEGDRTTAGEIADAYSFANTLSQFNREQIAEALELYEEFKHLSPEDQIAIRTLVKSREINS